MHIRRVQFASPSFKLLLVMTGQMLTDLEREDEGISSSHTEAQPNLHEGLEVPPHALSHFTAAQHALIIADSG